MYFNLYNELGNKIQEIHPDEFQTFSKFQSATASKMRLLDMIILRYNYSKKIYDEWWQETQANLRLYATSDDPEILRQSDAHARKGDFARRSIILDIESFLVFSRVMLDNIPWMLSPFFKIYISKNQPKTTDFRKLCDWFNKHPDEVEDKEFLKYILEFRDWFYENLRDPRNELVIHLERNSTYDAFSSDGKIIRSKNSPNSDSRLIHGMGKQLGSPPLLFEELIKFHKKLERFFLEKINS